MIQAWLVKYSNTKVLFLAIWLRHLQECIYLTNCRDVFWNKWFDLRFEIYLLRFVAPNIVEDLLQFRRNGQISILVRVIGTWHFFFILIIIFVFTLLLHLLLDLLLRCLLLLLLLRLCILLHVQVYFIIFLIGVNFFRVIYVDS